jgi:hypothetical protein
MATVPLIAGLCLTWWTGRHAPLIITGLAWLLIVLGTILTAYQLLWLKTPRLAHTTDQLLVYVRGLRPIRVPIDLVECFFLGQAPSLIVTPEGKSVENRTVVVRLAERAREWHRRKIRRALGQWCDGYITLRGTWCEPLDGELLNRMNAKLAKLQRFRKAEPR